MRRVSQNHYDLRRRGVKTCALVLVRARVASKPVQGPGSPSPGSPSPPAPLTRAGTRRRQRARRPTAQGACPRAHEARGRSDPTTPPATAPEAARRLEDANRREAARAGIKVAHRQRSRPPRALVRRSERRLHVPHAINAAVPPEMRVPHLAIL
eukprot:CAMPEP_0119352820 /NCGR_PEP_ID=MMETSP1334-20130426/2027_1 /TAXON_ID=127549 /ORGANISM="Calcidiscus leptoporus, Strain RCC1130" /LENGTH=153 /DNA_ID=CAMNT_0007365941 /DNA_START=212 /DNA_END=674 /DNA_ORIENTATION=+